MTPSIFQTGRGLKRIVFPPLISRRRPCTPRPRRHTPRRKRRPRQGRGTEVSGSRGGGGGQGFWVALGSKGHKQRATQVGGMHSLRNPVWQEEICTFWEKQSFSWLTTGKHLRKARTEIILNRKESNQQTSKIFKETKAVRHNAQSTTILAYSVKGEQLLRWTKRF